MKLESKAALLRSFVISVFIFTLLLFFSHPVFLQAAPDDDYVAEYSVLYAGNLSSSDAYVARNWLRHYGWNEQLFGDSHKGQVRWWSITGEYSIYPGEYSDTADFLYVSTHGTSDGDPRTNRQYIKVYQHPNYMTHPIDILYADGNDNPSTIKFVDKGWVSKPYRSNSKWDNDLEWIVIAACNQLEYFSSLEDGAHEYGKCLLGSPRRAHMILGYHDTAPDLPQDEKIIEWYIKYTVDRNYGRYSALNAWKWANREHNTYSWSAVYHKENVGEAMWSPYSDPSRVNVLPDTPTSSYPNIYFIYNPEQPKYVGGW